MEILCGVLVLLNFGVLGVLFTRDKVFGRRCAWTSCIDVNPCDCDCCGWVRRELVDVGGTLYGHVRWRLGLVPAFVRSGALMVTFREGMFIPGEVGLCASRELGFNEIPDNGGVLRD